MTIEEYRDFILEKLCTDSITYKPMMGDVLIEIYDNSHL